MDTWSIGFAMPRPRDGAHLKAQWFQILLALVKGEGHGSSIVRSVLDQTGGELRLWPATLYGALEALADEGLIRELRGEGRPAGKSRRRRYYQITASGRDALALEADRMARLARQVHESLGGHAA